MNTNAIGCKAVHREAEHICTELHVAATGLRVGQEAVGLWHCVVGVCRISKRSICFFSLNLA